MSDMDDRAQRAAELLYRYLILSRINFDHLGFVPPLQLERLETELLEGKRSFYGVEVSLDPPVIRADAEHDGFFLEYVWRGGFKNRLRMRRDDRPELVERAKALFAGLKRIGPLGSDGEFHPVRAARRPSSSSARSPSC